MEFRDYAAKEASAVLGRLLAGRTEASLQQIRVLREALDAATRAAEEAAAPPTDVEGELQELVRRLNNAATAAVRATAQRIQEDAAASLAAVQGDLEAERSRAEELSALLAEAQSHVDSLRGDLRSETQRAAVAERELAPTRERIEQLDRARIAAEAALQEQAHLRGGIEDELRESRGLLEAALSEAAQLHSQLDAAHRDSDSLRADLESARARLTEFESSRAAVFDRVREQEQARAALETEIEIIKRSLDDAIAESARVSVQRTELEAALAAAEAYGREQGDAKAAGDRELNHLRRSLDDALTESSRLSIQLEEAAAEKGGLEAEVAGLRAELVDLRATLAGVEAERDVNRASVVALENTQLEQSTRLSDLEARLDAAAHIEVSLRAELDEAEAAMAVERAGTNALHNRVDRFSALLDAAVLAADELAATSTIADLLHALVRQLSGVYSRVALFRLKGNRLEGEHQVGFDLSNDVTKLVIPLSLDSLIARAAASGTMEGLAGSEIDDSRHAPFGTSASAALAIPIVVGAETLAVVYAEEPAQDAPDAAMPLEQHATFAKLLVRHAVALLMRLTQELKAISELRDYAIMLIQEAEQMYIADCEANKPEEELRRRLRDTIEYARDLFSQRAAIEGPAAAPLLDAEIGNTIESQDGSPFARDLAAVTGHSESSGRAAEAS